MTAFQATSVLTCPECAYAETLEMPTDACVFFHECAGCGTVLHPKAGDCCVYCSYGSVPCPSIQTGMTDCCNADRAESVALVAPLSRSRQ
ncbi:MAG: GDCCVxC domain-containing (seleno)protein [Gemmatimonadota bacterium]